MAWSRAQIELLLGEIDRIDRQRQNRKYVSPRAIRGAIILTADRCRGEKEKRCAADRRTRKWYYFGCRFERDTM